MSYDKDVEKNLIMRRKECLEEIIRIDKALDKIRRSSK